MRTLVGGIAHVLVCLPRLELLQLVADCEKDWANAKVHAWKEIVIRESRHRLASFGDTAIAGFLTMSVTCRRAELVHHRHHLKHATNLWHVKR